MADSGAGDFSDLEIEKNKQSGVAFHVSTEEEGERRPRSAVPERLKSYKKRTVTREELEQKQLEAESRRKEKEQEMVRRILQARDDVSKLNHNFTVLLEAEAAQRGEGACGTVSRQQLKDTFHAVNADYNKMVKSIGAKTHCSN
ncbi:uncharacterized protein LOC143287947 [Babylonia areolata]|uniref:uncharacterized protein LOC143287947 n=1 Tax=Babylonia areolata TaxID=304850 RepID=UPI003FD2B23E